MPRVIDRVRARTLPQLAAAGVAILVLAAGIVGMQLGHHEFGSSLIGLGVVSLAPLMLWMRTTELPDSD